MPKSSLDVAYKFLGADGRGRFSRYPWPAPGPDRPGGWVQAEGQLEPCRNGVHACLASQLPLWIDDDLWVLEVDGDLVELPEVVVVRRGRLLERVEAWGPEAARAFAEACAERAHAVVGGENGRAAQYAEDASTYAAIGEQAQLAAVAGFVAAHAAEAVRPGSFAGERAWQATWLADRIGLPA